jgi:hypothetical protein
MDAGKIVLLLTFLATGLAMTALAIPLIRGRVRPNMWYGFRVRRTLEDPEVWYSANRYAAKWMLGVGLAHTAVAAALYAAPGLDLVRYALTCAAVLLTGLTVAIVQSFRYLRTLGT